MAGPTVLEVFNTLLKHLRMSVDFELGDSSRRNSASSVSSVRGKESEERIVQNAIIQTIGTSSSITPDCVCLNEHVPACVSKNNLECQRFYFLSFTEFWLIFVSRGVAARLLRWKSARLPASWSHDVHHGQSASVRDALPRLGHSQDWVSHTFIIQRRYSLVELQPVSSQLWNATANAACS